MMKQVSTTSSSLSFVTILKMLRLMFLQFPLYMTLSLLLVTHGVQRLYQGPLTELLKSLHIPDVYNEAGFYTSREPEITYYNRRCDLDDISTHDANDLLIHHDYTLEQRKDTMMTHGAVVMKNILSHNTSATLRQYLEQRHDTFMKNDLKLPWNELFWDGGDGSRLSLGIGPEDDPIIAQALHEVGQNKELEKTLTAILGPNPAIVEVSTLNTMVGATHQGIHTDSDYFGSSVLYARTFLHSYTMFVALQHTTARMGATTLCPGTHWCANEDLADVCMEPDFDGRRNSFEASSNGNTGLDSGALLQGDAMMFNQNVWHRGPQNKDPERPFTRAMFILTFVSQRPYDKGDVRQQGWGTYYYMRHSMWGQAFNDLKTVLKGGMNLPMRMLKAYGLCTTPSSSRKGHSPMPWLEHWARQMANNMDFFTRNELEEFKDMLATSNIFPKQLMGNSKTKNWNKYLLEMMSNATFWMNTIYGAVLVIFLVIHMLGYAIYLMTKKNAGSGKTQPNLLGDFLRFVGGLMVGHAFILGVFAATGYYVFHHAPLFRRITSGYIFRTPFPELPEGVGLTDRLEGRITTVPERMDVLVGSRFDADYLASMNEMLDYHPGNREWKRMIHNAAGFPNLDIASQVMVNEVTSNTKLYNGVIRRFLLQDYATGYWTVMDKGEAIKETKRALMMEKSPALKPLAYHWKQVMADARFGMLRDTAMAKTWIPQNVNAWMDKVLFAERHDKTTDTCPASFTPQASSAVQTPWSSLTKLDAAPSKPSSFRVHLQQMNQGIVTLKEGDTVLVKASPGKDHWLAKILEIDGNDRMVVRPVDLYVRIRLDADAIQVHRPVQQGDWVLVAPEEGYDDPDNWVYSQVALVHPYGSIDARIGGAVDDESDNGYDAIETVNPSEFHLAEDQVPEFRLDWV
jgi:hypothetical protein